MRKYTTLAAKCVSGLLTLSLIMSGSASSVFAEEAIADNEFSDESEMEGDGIGDIEEIVPSVFVIQGFTNFEKDPEGHFINEETVKKYGDLKALPGTPLDKLELPKDLELEGYWEADGPDVSAIYTMEDLKWKLKSDIGEIYSETSPEGVYTFIPDYEDYVLNEEGLDGIRLDENAKDLELSVTVAPEAQAETELLETESLETEPLETEFLETDPVEIGIIETELIPEETFVEDDGTVDYGKVDPAETEMTEEDIFAELDTEAFSEATGETYSDTPDDGVIVIDETETQTEPITEAVVVADPVPVNETEAPADPTPVIETEALTDPAPVIETETPADPTPVIETETPADPTPVIETETPADPLPIDDPAAEAPVVSFTLLNSDNSPLIDSTTNLAYTVSNITLKDNPAVNFTDLPCGLDLSSLHAQAVLSDDNTQLYNVTTDNNVPFESGKSLTAKVKVYETDYPITITLTKKVHTWVDATCAAPKHCSVCGATEGDPLPHTWKDATCTTPKTCTVCGATEGQPLGHDWKDATCTAPKTCQRCGATEGQPLGHDWKDATCTTPKTCQRCGATEGKALGHDLHDDWVTVEESTDTNHGSQERYCHRDNCDYYETRALNIIGNPEHNQINNLSQGANYDLNTRLTFSAIGAGTANTKPIDGDIRYIPSAWSIQGTAGSWLDNYTGAFSISKSGTYTVTVTFQQQVYNSGWANTNIADSRSVTFTIGGASADGTTEGVRINPQTGDDTPIIPIIIVMAAALILIIGLFIYKKKQK